MGHYNHGEEVGMARYFWYVEETGEVTSAMAAPPKFEGTDASHEDLAWAEEMAEISECKVVLIEGHDRTPVRDIYIVESGVVGFKTPFPELTVVNGTVSGLPYGTSVRWPDGELSTVFDGVAEIESNVGGNFRFGFFHAHHYRAELEVEYNV
jgi:hypothetical protein